MRRLPRLRLVPLGRSFCKAPKDGDKDTPPGFGRFERRDKDAKIEANQTCKADDKDSSTPPDEKRKSTLEEMKEDIQREFEESRKKLEEASKLKEKEQKDKDALTDYDFWKKKSSAKREEPTEKEQEKKKEEIKLAFFNKKDEQKDQKAGQENAGKRSFYQTFVERYNLKLNLRYLGAAAAVGLAVVAYYYLRDTDADVRWISEEEFFSEYLANGRIKTIKKKTKVVGWTYMYVVMAETKEGDKVRFTINSQSAFSGKLTHHFMNNPGHIVKVLFDRPSEDRFSKLLHINTVLGLLFLGLMIYSLVFRGNSQSGIGAGKGMFDGLEGMTKSLAKKYTPEMVKTTFKDVAGLREAKLELQEFVEFLKNPDKYKKLGARIPRGAIMSGPPGTGKTLMAKAVAGEAGVAFFTATGADFVEVFVGVGAARVRDLFANARKEKKAIIFIDEIDAIGLKRDGREGNDEREQTLNQLLVEMDGFGTSENIVVFAATNRFDMLDNALVRPGRFDRNVELTLPDLEARKDIFMVHLRNLKLNEVSSMEDYARRLATLTPGFSGSDIATICNEAAIYAVRRKDSSIDSSHFEEAVERLIGGVRTTKSISIEEEKTVAYHESGHGVVGWFLRGAMPLLKLTIIPRTKGALGFAQYLPKEDQAATKEEMMDIICSILAGRCAEQFFFGRVTTGAYDDLNKAYDIARRMVTQFGMSDKLGLIAYEEKARSGTRVYSDKMSHLIDTEIKAIIHECTLRCKAIIETHHEKIKAIAEKLLEVKTLDLKGIVEILGERPFPHQEGLEEYMRVMKENENEKETIGKKPQTESQAQEIVVKDNAEVKPQPGPATTSP